MNCRAHGLRVEHRQPLADRLLLQSGPPKAALPHVVERELERRWQWPTAIAARAMRSVWKFFITE
jgi:hypothetical protein